MMLMLLSSRAKRVSPMSVPVARAKSLRRRNRLPSLVAITGSASLVWNARLNWTRETLQMVQTTRSTACSATRGSTARRPRPSQCHWTQLQYLATEKWVLALDAMAKYLQLRRWWHPVDSITDTAFVVLSVPNRLIPLASAMGLTIRSTAVCATRGCVAAASQDSTTSPLSPPILYRARRMIGLVLGAMVWCIPPRRWYP